MFRKILNKLGFHTENQKSFIKELEIQIGSLKDSLTEAKTRIDQLETAANQIIILKNDLKEAVSRYKTTLEKENPEVLPDLIQGETIEELTSSLVKAKALTDKVKTNLEEKAREVHVPAGAPQRTEIDLESLSSTEKIKEGISRTRK
jgi:DNA repair exonuclease SbcCD ATPase subunit